MTKAGYVMAAQFCLQQLFAKLSILALFYRFFFVDVKFVRAIYAVGTVQVIWSIVTYMLHWFECTPPAKLWTPKMKGSCLNAPAFLAAGESINSVVDFVIVGLAIYMVQQLHLRTAVKARLAVLFGLGSL
jgi:large-conductance mechanosensitive channel